jgi:hypothetical protein
VLVCSVIKVSFALHAAANRNLPIRVLLWQPTTAGTDKAAPAWTIA